MKAGWMGIVGACAMLGGCGGGGPRVESASNDAPPVVAEWRALATTADRARLRGWRGAWVDALAQAKPADVARDAALFDPDRSLMQAMPPVGAYRCRIFKLGARAVTGPAFTARAWSTCRIARVEGRTLFSKTDGSQRPVGVLYPDTDARGIFLGTMELGDERTAMDYGRDASRDMAGLIERIGERRWRLVLPYPRFESTLDVIELVPQA